MTAEQRPDDAVLASDARDLRDWFLAAQTAEAIFARPQDAAAAAESFYYFRAAMSGLSGRHALAEAMLGALGGGASRSITEVTRHVYPDAPNALVMMEAYVSGFLFAAWSTFETTAFAVNALGYALEPQSFADLRSSKRLRGVSPSNVRGNARVTVLFPAYTAALDRRWTDIERLDDHHSASKHRHATLMGATFPLSTVGTLEALSDITAAPQEVRLPAQPRVARAERQGHVLPAGVTIPADAIVNEPTVSLAGLAVGWRSALGELGAAFRADVGRLARAASER